MTGEMATAVVALGVVVTAGETVVAVVALAAVGMAVEMVIAEVDLEAVAVVATAPVEMMPPHRRATVVGNVRCRRDCASVV
jgi:hypothetical protein